MTIPFMWEWNGHYIPTVLQEWKSFVFLPEWIPFLAYSKDICIYASSVYDKPTLRESYWLFRNCDVMVTFASTFSRGKYNFIHSNIPQGE